MTFLETSKPILREDFLQVESNLKIKFPGDFKEHFLKYNGGYPEKGKYSWSEKETTHINCFMSIKHKGFVSLESTYKDLAIIENYLPAGIVPFATDDGGNFFCISTRAKDYNYVYYCNDDHYDGNDEKEYLELLTKGFNEFLDRLV